MLLWIVVTLQGIAILCLSLSLKRQSEVIEMIFDFINKTHTDELIEFLCERNEKELEEKNKKKEKRSK